VHTRPGDAPATARWDSWSLMRGTPPWQEGAHLDAAGVDSTLRVSDAGHMFPGRSPRRALRGLKASWRATDDPSVRPSLVAPDVRRAHVRAGVGYANDADALEAGRRATGEAMRDGSEG
jgi:hypothetical protein